MYTTTLDQIKGDTGWTTAEQQLLDEAHTGHVQIADTRPTENTDATRIRAALVVHVVMGGCDALRPPAKGVRINGAWIAGLLDMDGCKTDHALKLRNCTCDTQVDLDDATLGAMYLPGTHCPGLRAHRLVSKSNVHLSDGFHSTGPVELLGARITGQLDCTDGNFETKEGTALDCNAAEIGADVFLRNGFKATGTVDFIRARITGQLDCTGGTFEAKDGTALNCDAAEIGANAFLSNGFKATGTVNFRGARITGQLACTGGTFEAKGETALDCEAAEIGADVFLRNGFTANGLVDLVHAAIGGNLTCKNGSFSGGLDGEGMTVTGGLFLHSITAFTGPLDLTDAHVGRIHDDKAAWSDPNPLILNGFRYERLSGDMRVSERLQVLARKTESDMPAPETNGHSWIKAFAFASQHVNRPYFNPQPHAHMAKVLREQGNTSGAAAVLMDKDKRLAKATFDRTMVDLDGSPSAGLRALAAPLRLGFSTLFGAVFGYGHRPARAIWYVLALYIFTTWFYGQVWQAGHFAPTSSVILTSTDWVAAVKAAPTTGVMPLHAWQGTPSEQDYESFSHWLYGFDVFIPLDALGQEAAWAPSPIRGGWGWWGFYLKPAIQILGWVITAVGAAAVTGLVGKRD